MGSRTVGLSRSACSQQGTSLAEVIESALANSVTSWPCATSSSVRYETMRSVPPIGQALVSDLSRPARLDSGVRNPVGRLDGALGCQQPVRAQNPGLPDAG